MENCFTEEGLLCVDGDDSARMNETYQLQELRSKLNELKHLLSREITDSVALRQQNEYEKRSWEYLIRYFNERLERCHTLFAATIPKPFGQLHWGNPTHRALGHQMIHAVATCLNAPNSDSLTFQDLAQHLSERTLLSVDDPALNIQVVFHIVGWLTGVWDPVWSGTPSQAVTETLFEVNSCRLSGKRRFYKFDRHAVRRTHIPIQEVQGSQIYHVMGGAFGKLLPRPEQYATHSRASRPSELESENIPKAYFSWQALSQQGYRISWTSTLAEHLQMDQRHRTLLIYQHPSLCWLLYKRKGSNLLSRLFSEEQKQRALQEGLDLDDDPFGINDFFDDLLRSYRLIFDRASVPWLLSMRHARLRLPTEDCDPLLYVLCMGGTDSAILRYLGDDLEVAPVKGARVDLDEYPFLGKRLGLIAKIGKGSHNPNSPWKLWIEKFNANGQSYRWVLFFLALVALVLQAIQTIFSTVPTPVK